ncbi:hypothetical protein D6C78_07927 [Aureobasidium pullulans]|uniref:FabD/lysophospholipase-like protein n=1 Tax=Aureobasidium pullulans TaxID=5580 RepID=A0A4T0BKY8_AURPU|nr:hypothetical protein D6C78_07927 [Aureobasidium pullulans]
MQRRSEGFEAVLDGKISVLSTYLTRHSFLSRHWTVLGEHSQPNSFANKQFKLRYQHLAQRIVSNLIEEHKQLLPAPRVERYSPQALERRIQDRWLKDTKDVYSTCASVLDAAKAHIKKLRSYRGYLSDGDFGNYCAACMLEPWTHLLPCGHGLCTLCLRACNGQEMIGCRMEVDECPTCERDIGSQCIRKFVPPTVAPRVLALDGGGVKGMVQLEILTHLLKEVDLGDTIHISTFFDLIVGSSIGIGFCHDTFHCGLCALGLGTKGWSLEECKEKFLQLSHQIFAPRSRTANFFSRVSGGWFSTVVSALRIFLLGGICNSAIIDRCLRDSFGNSSLMIQPNIEHVTKVAVIVNEASTSGTTLFSNYNKLRHHKNKSYTWPATNKQYQSLKVWKAFWRPVKLLSKIYQDGGLSSNNPSAIARNEGNLLAGSNHSNGITVSVGCGRLYTAPLTQMSVFRRLIRAFDETLNAEKQHETVKLLTKGARGDLIRLNPKLDLNEVLLNDLSCLSSLRESFQEALNSGSNGSFLVGSKTAARRLIASLFYFELDHKVRKGENQGETLQKGFIHTRLNEEELSVFRESFPKARFRIGKTEVEFTIPAEVEISYTSRTDMFGIELVERSWEAQISGSPFSVSGLLEAQYEYLPVGLSGRRKRRRA